MAHYIDQVGSYIASQRQLFDVTKNHFTDLLRFDAMIELADEMKLSYQKKVIDKKPKYTIRINLIQMLIIISNASIAKLDPYAENVMLQITLAIEKEYLNQNFNMYAEN